MDLEQRVHILEKINAVFYEVYADTFSHTRQYAWQGWKEVLQEIQVQDTDNLLHHDCRILDLGCGNGRFLSFLIEQIHQKKWHALHQYLGLDRSLGLLEYAQQRIEPDLDHTMVIAFKHWDWQIDLQNVIDQQKYHIICMFGVLHHIANYQRRVDYLKKFAACLANDGYLCVSIWDFGAQSKGLNAALDWDQTATRFGLDAQLKEEGDYFLGWQGNGDFPRYCHYLSLEEEGKLIEDLAPVLTHITSLSPSSEMNRYLLFKKNQDLA